MEPNASIPPITLWYVALTLCYLTGGYQIAYSQRFGRWVVVK